MVWMVCESGLFGDMLIYLLIGLIVTSPLIEGAVAVGVQVVVIRARDLSCAAFLPVYVD